MKALLRRALWVFWLYGILTIIYATHDGADTTMTAGLIMVGTFFVSLFLMDFYSVQRSHFKSARYQTFLAVVITVILYHMFFNNNLPIAQHISLADDKVKLGWSLLVMLSCTFVPNAFRQWVINNKREQADQNREDELGQRDEQWMANKISEINHRYDTKQGEASFSMTYPEKGLFTDLVWPESAMVQRFSCHLGRSLSAMEHRERESLRSLELMEASGLFDPKLLRHLEAQLVWADGKAEIVNRWYLLRHEAQVGDSDSEKVSYCLKELTWFHNFDAAFTRLLSAFEEMQQQFPQHLCIQAIDRYIKAGNAWLEAGQFEDTPFTPQQPATGGLFLGKLGGQMDDNHECWFTGQGSVITVAQPGAGKTQTHVLPNLLTWNGPAVVLDVKGELWDKTAGRRAELGPVYKFAPLDPDNSHSFNPLIVIRNNPDTLWEDCKYLADLLVVPTPGSKDPFWENRARDLITAAIAVECMLKPPEERDMANVVKYCYGRDWSRFLATLDCAEINAMQNAAQTWINTSNESSKTLDGIRQQAQTFLSAWEGSRVERATRTSDWHPLDLRQGGSETGSMTLYISLNAGEIDTYASLLRTFIGLHIRTLVHDLPADSAPDILFMLDEVPRLKHMPPIEEALELGRQYKIKLFMVIQSIGQLKQHYKNADGFIGSCAVRAYMDPSSHDGTAEKLSKELGQIESIVDGSRRQLAEINDLTGPDYKDSVLILRTGTKPIKALKSFAYLNQQYTHWMKLQPPDIKRKEDKNQ